MHRLLLCHLAALALYAQNPTDLFNRPPAGVDEALRARITEFYQYHVKQQFRQAEELVAKDTKEFFYTRNKPQYLGFEIQRIEYSKDFTQAKATMVTEQYVMMPGFSDKPMKIPSPSTWKLEDGKWCWWIDPASLGDSPFGHMKPGAIGGGAASKLPTIPSSPGFVMGKVKAEKDAVTLKPGESVEVRFNNAAEGYMNLRLIDNLVGVEGTFDQYQMKPGGSVVLKLTAAAGARSGIVGIRVDQTLELIDIAVKIEPGPALPAMKPAAPEPVLSAVKAEKESITLKPGGSGLIKLSSTATGPVTLRIAGKPAGIIATFDHVQLKPGGGAVLKLAAAKGAKSGTVKVLAGESTISIAVSVK